jgi:hypothetical protein
MLWNVLCLLFGTAVGFLVRGYEQDAQAAELRVARPMRWSNI